MHAVASTAGNASLIGSRAVATVSARIVPDQEPERVVAAIREHLLEVHTRRRSRNTLLVTADSESQAGWWQAKSGCPGYAAASRAVEAVWGQVPQLVKEGGTMRTAPFLEVELGCSAIHVPLGQPSDRPHLPNESVRLRNLVQGSHVISRFLWEFNAGQS